MRNRVMTHIKGNSNAVPWLGTFHSISVKFLRRHAEALGYKSKKCRAMRTDGAFIEAGEQDNLIVQKLQQFLGTILTTLFCFYNILDC